MRACARRLAVVLAHHHEVGVEGAPVVGAEQQQGVAAAQGLDPALAHLLQACRIAFDPVGFARHHREALVDQLERRSLPGLGMVAAAVQVERLAAVADQALGLLALAAQLLGTRAHRLELGVEPADHVEQGPAELAAEGAGQVGPAQRPRRHAGGRVEAEADQRLAARVAQGGRPRRVGGPDAHHRDALLVRQAERNLTLQPPVALVRAPLRGEVVGRHQHHQQRSAGDLLLQLGGERRHRIEALLRAVVLVAEHAQAGAEAPIGAQLALELVREGGRPWLEIGTTAAVVAVAVAHEQVVAEGLSDVGHENFLAWADESLRSTRPEGAAGRRTPLSL